MVKLGVTYTELIG